MGLWTMTFVTAAAPDRNGLPPSLGISAANTHDSLGWDRSTRYSYESYSNAAGWADK
ncbi:hypothetical protein [Streptomyces sp. NPDC058964]|uniref:hypothetical protein n=1 Tax=Streptomyces sp. NPDC058964 TaxID=3346681 RepID=UPI0036B4EB0F